MDYSKLTIEDCIRKQEHDNGSIQSCVTEYQTKGNGQSENSVIAAGRHCDRPFLVPQLYPNFYPNLVGME